MSFEMDIFWIQFGGGDPVALLKKYGSRWKLMHLKDSEGELDMPGILKQAQKTGIKHYFIEDESSQVNIKVPKSIAYLKSLKH